MPRNCITFAIAKYGLFNLLPELDDLEFKPKLCIAVENFRVRMVSVSRAVAPIEGQIALQIASLFEKDFTMPLMVALLSLRRRAADDGYFLRLISNYAGIYLPTLDMMKMDTG